MLSGETWAQGLSVSSTPNPLWDPVLRRPVESKGVIYSFYLTTSVKHLPGARHCSKNFTEIKSSQQSNKISLSPFYRWGNQGAERLRILPTATQRVSDVTGI